MLPTGSELVCVASQSMSRVRLFAPCAWQGEANEIGRPVHHEASQRAERSILRPDPIRWERQCESHVGSVLWITPSEEATGLSKFVDVVRLFMLSNVSPKDSQAFLKGVRGLAAPPREFVAMGFYLVEQILGHMQIVPAQNDEATGRGVTQQGRDEDVRVDDEFQGPSPRPRRPPLPVLLPDALLH